jgi:hypothetical protein
MFWEQLRKRKMRTLPTQLNPKHAADPADLGALCFRPAYLAPQVVRNKFKVGLHFLGAGNILFNVDGPFCRQQTCFGSRLETLEDDQDQTHKQFRSTGVSFQLLEFRQRPRHRNISYRTYTDDFKDTQAERHKAFRYQNKTFQSNAIPSKRTFASF